MNNKLKNIKGFTFIEMMVILSIIGILTVTAMPNLLAWMENEKLKEAADDISFAIKMARSKAVETGLEHRVYVNKDDKTFQIDQGNAFSTSGVWTPFENAKLLPDSGNIEIGFGGRDSAQFPLTGICILRPDGTVVQPSGVLVDNNSYIYLTNKTKRMEVEIISSRTGTIVVRKAEKTL